MRFNLIYSSELKRLTKALPGLKSELIQTEREYESVSSNNERTNQSLISVRSQLEEAKSSLEAHKNRYTCTCTCTCTLAFYGF